jgi:hypothetical protein
MLTLVLASRIILGLHSINQILFGSLIGIWIYLVLIHIFKLNKMSMITYRKIYQKCKYKFFISLIFFISILIPIICFAVFNQQLDYINLNKNFDLKCNEVKQYRRFNNEGLFGCLIIIPFIGFYYGQFIFWYFSDKYYKKNMDISNNDYYLLDELINTWNKNKCLLFQKKTNFLKIIEYIIICFSPVILFFLISSDNKSMLIIFVVKFAIPLFLISFLFFGIGFYCFITLYCGNKEKILNNYYQINMDDL